MTPICCQRCDGRTAYRIRPDRIFECPECGNLLNPGNIDLDGMEVWGVGTDGTLCTVTAPQHSLELLMEAVEESLTADECPNAEYAHLDSTQKVKEALAAYAEARRLGIKRPGFGHTEESIRDAVNAGADLILGNLSIDESGEDAINLVVNAAITCLDRPNSTFEEMVQEKYSETADEIRAWWGW